MYYLCALTVLCVYVCTGERRTERARKKLETGGIGHIEFKSVLCFCVDITDEL